MKNLDVVSLKLGNTNVDINKVHSDGMIVTLTSNVYGLKVIMKLNNGVIGKLKKLLYDSRSINSTLRHELLIYMRIKCRECTKISCKVDTYEYHDTKRGITDITTVNGCAVVRIGDESHTYCNFCFEIADAIYEIEKLSPIINRITGEEMMNEWF